ncbi:putative tRNA sulfurtransferase [Methanimicrococcus stummii]|uniref:Probable tRNA sulfurtransferase n=1 Tax=Methanimicrococcus stummii TaxID=3028294 RepID=A0AA97A7X5_9EURY|nr:tRNA uracil 4-sulfurtransferase ThiI [Methanimicrococcus sp. Es2]WNY28463.1 putative tRNA sulfurtransferase [Methanimicrococcus sp. Es2]
MSIPPADSLTVESDSENFESGQPEKTIVIVRYGELSLKSKGVRDRYEQILKNNIQQMLEYHNVSFSKIQRDFGRIFIHSSDPAAAKITALVFGVVSVSSAYLCSSDPAEITAFCANTGEKMIADGETFAVRARRAGNHSFTSNEIARQCGDAIWEKLAASGKTPAVDLTNPDKEIFVEVRQTNSYVYFETIKGPGGFPTGTQGKMVVLLSGGIDSPVGAWLMMKRGIEIIPVFFDNEQYAGSIVSEKAIENAKVLFSWTPGRRQKIYRIKNGEYMDKMMQTTGTKNICLMCKRFMFRVAGAVMDKEKASGIITGSSLGQVASQTAENMLSETYGLSLPLYHPLLAFDKQEIVDIAQRIGTFDISIRSDGGKECLAVPEKPEVKAILTAAVSEEEKFVFDIDEMVQKTVENAEIIEMKI